MTNKEYLSRPFHLQRRIDAKRRKLATLESLVGASATTISDMPKADPSPTRFEDMVVRVIDLKDSIATDEEELRTTRIQVAESIAALSDPKLITIMEYRYLLYMSWEDIMVRTGYCRSYMYELHGRALRKVGNRK